LKAFAPALAYLGALGTCHPENFENIGFKWLYLVPFAGLLTGCGRKIKIVRDLGGKLCREKRRLCGELCGIV